MTATPQQPPNKRTPPASDPVRQAHAQAQAAQHARLAALITRASKRASMRKPTTTAKAAPARQAQRKAEPDINGDDDLTRAVSAVAAHHGISEDHVRAMIHEHMPSKAPAKGKASKKKPAA